MAMFRLENDCKSERQATTFSFFLTQEIIFKIAFASPPSALHQGLTKSRFRFRGGAGHPRLFANISEIDEIYDCINAIKWEPDFEHELDSKSMVLPGFRG